jgi:hypothetical protein
MLLVAKIHETDIGLESVHVYNLTTPTRLRIIGTISFTDHFLTTCVYTFPFRLISPKITISPPDSDLRHLALDGLHSNFHPFQIRPERTT